MRRITDDRLRCYGSVPYAYQMGKYDVTVGQYCQFLNAVAKTDTYGLYNSDMATNLFRPSALPRAAVRAATATRSRAATAKPPIVRSSMSPGAMRHGSATGCKTASPTGGTLVKGPGTTETGAYTLNGAITNSALMAITRNAGATYFIPSENEWYKAAYYKGGEHQRRLLDLPDAEQHRADQHAAATRDEQRQLFTSSAATPIRRTT